MKRSSKPSSPPKPEFPQISLMVQDGTFNWLPVDGAFFSVDNTADWKPPYPVQNVTHCREIFAERHFYRQNTGGKPVRELFKVCGYHTRYGIPPSRVAKFFRIVETRLRIPKKQRSEVMVFDSRTIVLSVAEFWRQNLMRAQVFTLFLRAAAICYREEDATIWKCLHAKALSRSIKPFLKLFFEGWTQYNKRARQIQPDVGYGINAQFAHRSKEGCLRYLKKPCSTT